MLSIKFTGERADLDGHSGSLAPKLAYILTTASGHFRSVGSLASTESKPLILQWKQQGAYRESRTRPRSTGQGGLGDSGALLRIKGGKRRGRWGDCRFGCIVPVHPAPKARAPSFHFGTGYNLMWGGWEWVDSGSHPTFFILRIPRQPLSREECSASSPEGRGLLPCSGQACFVLVPGGPSRPSPARSSEHFLRASKPGR